MSKPESSKGRAARRATLFVICLLVLAASTLPPARAQTDDSVRESRQFAQAALKAYEAKDYAAYLLNMERAAALRPNHPTLLYKLAGAHALNAHAADALKLLRRLADMGLIVDADKDSDFDSIKTSAEFQAVVERFAANRLRVGHSEPALTLGEKGLITEGVAYDPVEDVFYVSSVYRRKIVRVRRDGTAEDFAPTSEGLWSVFGMKVDARRRLLWVTTAAHAQMSGYREEENGMSAVVKFDLRTGKPLKRYLLPNTTAKHSLGDLVIDARGDVFTTDSLNPAIYRITPEKDEIEPFIVGPPFVSPQGLDFSKDGRLFVADYSLGVFVVNTATKSIKPLAAPADATLLGIDGLYFHKGSLIGVQNGVQPQRVVRLRLDKKLDSVERLEVLEANSPHFDEPTLGVLVGGDFYYVADSQWGAIDSQGLLAPLEKLREHVILKLKL